MVKTHPQQCTKPKNLRFLGSIQNYRYAFLLFIKLIKDYHYLFLLIVIFQFYLHLEKLDLFRFDFNVKILFTLYVISFLVPSTTATAWFLIVSIWSIYFSVIGKIFWIKKTASFLLYLPITIVAQTPLFLSFVLVFFYIFPL